MNQRFRCPSLSSPVDSAQATLPAGYSPLLHSQPNFLLNKVKSIPNADTHKEPPRSQSRKKSLSAAASAVRAGGKGREDEEDDGRGHQSPFARIVIAHPAKEKLAHYGAGEGDGRYIGLGA